VHGSQEADLVVTKSEGYAQAVPCTVGQLISLVRRAAVVVAGDTGPLHLAAALERPVVGIFGPHRPGAQRSVRDACPRAARCHQPDQPQAQGPDRGWHAADHRRRSGAGGAGVAAVTEACRLGIPAAGNFPLMRVA